MIELSAQQQLAFDDIMSWFMDSDNMTRGQQYYALAGYAGTGKTTMAKNLYDKLRAMGKRVGFAAYTGKAAHVLSMKGCPASTIHSLIYTYVGDDADGNPTFTNVAPFDLQELDLLIVDEYSMLGETIVDDLLEKGVRVLFLGDIAQLPPIEGTCPIDHDFTLTEIHRQAWESPIIRAATRVRNGERLRFGNYGDFKYRHRKSITNLKKRFVKADQIICGYNKTRRMLNTGVRRELGFTYELPENGDKMICLKNNHAYGLYNGLIGTAYSKSRIVNPYFYRLYFRDDFMEQSLNVWNGDLFDRVDGKERQDDDTQRFDFGYAITCHKAQGSEFDKLIVINEPVGLGESSSQTWLYTAITRAKQKLLLIDF